MSQVRDCQLCESSSGRWDSSDFCSSTERKLPREQVLDRITHDRTLTPEQRAKALDFARFWRVTE